MKHAELIHITNKRFANIKKHLAEIDKNFDPAAIHNFRVEIKRLRAFTRLMNAGKTGNKVKPGKKLEAFYACTGTIRNLQLFIQNVPKSCEKLELLKPVSFLQVLNKELETEKAKALHLATRISVNRSEEKLEQGLPARLTPVKIQSFIETRYGRLSQLLALTVYHDEALHEMRKILKDFLYVWDFIDIYPTPVFYAGFLELQNIETLTEKLGDFHDLCMAIYYTGFTGKNHINVADEATILGALQNELTVQKKKLKEEILAILYSEKHLAF